MAPERLSFADYLKEAFRFSPRLGWLGRMPANGMGLAVFLVLGLANPGFWFLGLAAEVGYLALVSSNPRFQRLVQARRQYQRQQGWEQRVVQVFTSLSPSSQERYRGLLTVCGQILGISERVAQESLGSLSDARSGGLNQLLWLFLRLLSSREILLSNVSQVDRTALEADIDRLKARLAEVEADSPLARSLQATLEIQGKRLENLAKATINLTVIDAELERIEQQVRLIREEVAISGGPEILSARLDAVSSVMAETTRWMDQNAELLGALTSDEVEVSSPSLPRLPDPEPAAAPPPPPPRAREGN